MRIVLLVDSAERMSVLLLVSRKLFGLFHVLLATFRKILCLFKRREKEPDVLPFTVADRSATNPYRTETSLGESSSEAGWSDWTTGGGAKPSVPVQRVAPNMPVLLDRRRTISETEAEEPEPDFFQDMTPSLKNPKKLIVMKKSAGGQSTNRFAVQTSGPIIPETSGELGDLVDYSESASEWWDVDDSSLDADSVLKEAKQRERQSRVEQHMRKKLQKQGGYPSAQTSQFETVKIS